MFNVRSKITKAILVLFFEQEGGKFYVNELARMLRLDPGNLYRKLVELEIDQILFSQKRGNQKYYYLNSNFPLLAEYRKIFLRGQKKDQNQGGNCLPRIFQGILWAYDIQKMDVVQDKELIITNTLIYGTEKEIEWIFGNYSLHDISNCVMNPRPGEWDKKSLFFWAKMLKLPLTRFERAIINLKV
jgi:hypothetical protein